YDAILKFKIVVLQSLHNLSDEQTEYLIRDRLSFMRFLDLDLEDPVPDATTIWLFREVLAQAGLIDKLFERFASISRRRAALRAAGRSLTPRLCRCLQPRGHARQSEARGSARSLQHRQWGMGGQRLPLGPDRGEPEGEGLAEPYRRSQSSAVRCAPVSSTYSASSRTRWAA